MLNNVDGEYELRIGMRLRFPLGSITHPVCSLTNPIYPRDWEIAAFGGPARPGSILVRRLHDGIVKWVGERWVAKFLDANKRGNATDINRENRARARRSLHARLWAAEMAARTEGWQERPCYYVTVRRDEDYRALAGPFATHASALLQVRPATNAALAADVRSHWYAYGTALLTTGHAPVYFPDLNHPK